MNNNEIMVTVLCAAYNHEKYIRDALEGFVMQKTSFAFEVLVHDDASTDSTAEIIREYEQKYPEIIKPIYQTENQYSKGVNRLFTFMLPRARGKYIAVCEGDDYWTSPDKLQKQVDYIESHPECALVSHLAMMSYVDRNYVTKYTDRDFSTPERCIVSAEEIIAKHTIFPTASMLFRRDYYERNRELLSSVRLFDYVGKIMLATEGTVYVIPEVMSVYRRGSESSWTKHVYYDAEKMEKHLNMSIETLRKIDEYREFKYHDAIEANILSRRFDILVKTRNIKAMKKEPYRDIYMAMSLKERALLHAEKYAPWLAVAYTRLTSAVKRVIYKKNKLEK